ncbi:MAG: peptide chain release factor 2 [Clostridia bacterium]|nr:peptide chain release factor 2 [Clostridia bacterium]
MELLDVKNILQESGKLLEELKETLKIQDKKNKLKELEEKTAEDGFWNDQERSQEVLKEIKELKQAIMSYENVENLYNNNQVTYELLLEEMDNTLFSELEKDIKKLETECEKLKISSLLSGEYDKLNSIITIHSGAGGTESQDWAQMLFRMYQKWSDKNAFDLEIYDTQEGDEAGIKSITFGIKGINSYGYLKCEKGVHRLVRISPFDANKRRHTSFAAVDVMPEIDDSINIEIRAEDLEVGTYRASGAGGQHINKTDSAVRIKHIPTGIVVSCQTERSQIQNRETCIKMLKSKLYQYEQEKTQEKLKEIKGEISENAFGSQIRSYVFCPYTLVKDHRTNAEVGNVSAVMDGQIDEFIFAYLKMLSIEK